MIRNRHSNTPNAVFASNDCHVRVLNCGEGLRFISEHEYDWPVNCSVTSPDLRLRAVVGDHTDVVISDAERGKTEFVLPGHRDFGFAVAWSDDGYTIATGNQDKTVRIFDARSLKKTVKVLPATMAGVRALRFSPIGYGGKRVLAMAEPADIVQIVDAVSWDSMQEIEFWGEVGGIDFDPSGEEFFIANADKCVGGLMEFSRTKGSEYYENYGRREIGARSGRSSRRRKRRTSDDDYDSDDEDENAELGEDLMPAMDYSEAESEGLRWDRGKYYNSRRYKRLGHDIGNLYI
jgi:WD40 repeat protein